MLTDKQMQKYNVDFKFNFRLFYSKIYYEISMFYIKMFFSILLSETNDVNN